MQRRLPVGRRQRGRGGKRRRRGRRAAAAGRDRAAGGAARAPARGRAQARRADRGDRARLPGRAARAAAARHAAGPARCAPRTATSTSTSCCSAATAWRCIDLDGLCLAAPALDLATYAADVVAAATATSAAVAAVLDPLIAGYGGPPPDLEWHLATAILTRAAHPFQRQVDDWKKRVAAMVARRRRPLRALVTGCAGFVGSHLSESLLADGHAVRGVDCFTDNYEGAGKRANLARRARDDGFRLIPSTSRPPTLGRCWPAATSSSTWPASRACARAGASASTATCATTCPPRSGCSRRRAPGERFVYASSSSVYGDAQRAAHARGRDAPAALALRRDQARGRAAVHLYHAKHGVDTVALRYFTVYGPRQRPDMAFRRFCAALAGRGADHLYGDGHRRATSPTSTTWWRRTAGGRGAASAGACTTSAADRGRA